MTKLKRKIDKHRVWNHQGLLVIIVLVPGITYTTEVLRFNQRVINLQHRNSCCSQFLQLLLGGTAFQGNGRGKTDGSLGDDDDDDGVSRGKQTGKPP